MTGSSYGETQDIQAAPAPPLAADSCAAYRSDGYECVPYYQCEDGEIIDDGAGLFDIRFVRSHLDPFSPANSIEKGPILYCQIQLYAEYLNILLANGRNGFIDPESSKCPNYLEECCRLPDYFEPVTAPPRPSK